MENKNHTFNKKCVTALILITCFLVLMFLVRSVKAQSGPVVTSVTQSCFCPYVDGSSHPYVAGYMTFDQR